MTMTGRFVDHGIRILAALALLALVSSLIRPAGASHTIPSRDCLPRNFVILKIGRGGQFAMSARPSLREDDSLRSDIADERDADVEDELTGDSPPAVASFDVLPTPSPEAYSERVSHAAALAARPLRC
jgi:hypothetical protein